MWRLAKIYEHYLFICKDLTINSNLATKGRVAIIVESVVELKAKRSVLRQGAPLLCIAQGKGCLRMKR